MSSSSSILPQPFYPVSLRNSVQEREESLPDAFPAVPTYRIPDPIFVPTDTDPDKWVPRDQSLIPLTGKHPFNCEPPLTVLFNAGFITPAHLHFVRSHGAVPQCPPLPSSYETWQIQVHGRVARPKTFTVRDLAETFQVVTLPVTMVCAGNRRKEQNVARKSLGFSWGSAGLSTALWTGVYLSDILAHVRPLKSCGARHVIFEGADQLPKGPYGTSQKLSWAEDKAKGMLIAWAMNGLPLEPDHGFPVRLIVPGQIGGRMVKWLTRIQVSDVESHHYLHYWDNKVLPMQLTPERARDEPKWWYDPRYIITELNVNSAIAQPAHGDTLTVSAFNLSGSASPPGDPPSDDGSQANNLGTYYPVRGYAYAGGGRRITRVELSLDDGRNWELADVEYPEDQFRSMSFRHPVYGLFNLTERDSCFCWCFWTIRVPVAAIASAGSLTVRAMDEGMNTQPRDMYLNATGMMNNWWFRIAIRKTDDPTSLDGALQLTFEHPAPVDPQSGKGWMERMNSEGKDILEPVFSSFDSVGAESRTAVDANLDGMEIANGSEEMCAMTKAGVDRKMTLEELRAQLKDKPWFVVHGQVYDATGYLKDHPGGADSILLVAGEDATDDFKAIHSADARKKLAEFHIGTLVDSLDGDALHVAPAAAAAAPPGLDTADTPFLNPKVWKPATLTSIERINHDSIIYRLALPLPDQPLGLPVGQHVYVRLRRKDNGELVQRAYTPVSPENTKGSVDFLVKLYLPAEKWPLGGKMSVGLDQLEVGDTLDIKGPLGSFVWKGAGLAVWRGESRKVTDIGLVCGGSGITPILQVLRSVLYDASDATTRLWLVSANKTEADILCRAELDRFLQSHGASGRFHLHYTLSATPPPDGWCYSKGRVSEEMLREHLPVPGEGRMVLACGPQAMMEDSVIKVLKKCGWDVENDLVIF